MLTPLERELLTCVEELTRTCETSVASLKESERALKQSEMQVRELKAIFAQDLMPCIAESAKLQTELLRFWAISSSDHKQLRRLQEAMNRQSDALTRRVQALEATANRISGRR